MTTTRRNPFAVALGRRGGAARAKRLTAAERTASARKAAKARWKQVRSRKAKSA